MALVGRVHNCTPSSKKPARYFCNVDKREKLVTPEDPLDELADADVPSTYRYRDAEARRTYMKEYMRKRRDSNR